MTKESGGDRQEGERLALEGYYRFHAGIYDLTRWAFLFGRSEILRQLGEAGGWQGMKRLKEVGCGTGRNLLEMRTLFPTAQLFGVDLSEAMLDRARLRLRPWLDSVDLCLGRYPQGGEEEEADRGMDGIVFSYALTMFNPGWELAIDAAARDLSDEGLIAVVDFHDTPCAWFGRWMGINHVRMEGHLLPRLRERFEPVYEEERRAFGGLWRYFLFIGRRSVRGGV